MHFEWDKQYDINLKKVEETKQKLCKLLLINGFNLHKVNYDFSLFYPIQKIDTLYEYSINKDESIIIGMFEITNLEGDFGGMVEELQMVLISTYKTFNFIDDTNTKHILPMAYNKIHSQRLNIEKEHTYDYQTFVHNFEQTLKEIKSTSTKEKKDFLTLIQLRANILSAENKFKQKHKEISQKMIEQQNNKGITKNTIVKKNGFDYAIYKMKVVYDYLNFYKPTMSFKLRDINEDGTLGEVNENVNMCFLKTNNDGSNMLVETPNKID